MSKQNEVTVSCGKTVVIEEQPLWISLRSERVEAPESLTGGERKRPPLYDIGLSHRMPVTIDIPSLELSITIHSQREEVA
jgi:hypothetical protein